VRAADAVVRDRDPQRRVALGDFDRNGLRTRVLHRIRQRFRDEVVDADLDRLGRALAEAELQVDGEGRPAGERTQRRLESRLGQDARVEPA
jgi:hypothetical protein